VHLHWDAVSVVPHADGVALLVAAGWQGGGEGGE
jgi:hypothetical protein